ncbi:MAG: cytochrome c oxidase subunit 3 [Candidatus Eisenbacteria bacterium]
MTAPAAATDGIARPRRGRLAENGVFGMALFVLAEVMMFSGFISAHIISQRSALPGTWPPPDQPRLPVASTAFNTAALLLSGVVLLLAHRAYRRGQNAAAKRWLGASILLGTAFVGLQGAEWARLLAQGLTVSSSLVGGFFYLIVGAHALHAVAALGFLVSAWLALRAGRLTPSHFGAAQVFWYFVVLLWPVLYAKVYL